MTTRRSVAARFDSAWATALLVAVAVAASACAVGDPSGGADGVESLHSAAPIAETTSPPVTEPTQRETTTTLPSTPQAEDPVGGLTVDDPSTFVSDEDGGWIVRNQLVLVIDPESGPSTVDTIVDESVALLGGRLAGRDDRLGVFQVDVDGPMPAEAADTVTALDGVIGVGQVRALEPLVLQIPDDADDPVWDGIDVTWPYELLGLDENWPEPTGDPVGVLVADWGLLDSHPDLGFVEPPTAVFDDPPDARLPWDITQVSHGSIVAGVACGRHDGQGAFGVADGCNLYGLDMLYDLTAHAPELDVPRFTGVTFATTMHEMLVANPDIRVVNASWGFGPNPADGCTGSPDPVAVWALYQLMSFHSDVTFVTGAGNCGIDVPALDSPDDLHRGPYQFPASAAQFLPNVIAVTAVDENLTVPAWANTGPAVTLAAPGVSSTGEGIWGPAFDCGEGTCEPTYGSIVGTSVATPFITGLVAAMFQTNPELTQEQLSACLDEAASRPVTAARPEASVDSIRVPEAGVALTCSADPDGDDSADAGVDALSLREWAERYWAEPPGPVEVVALTLGGRALFTYLLGPIVDGERIFITRVDDSAGVIVGVGVGRADFDPTRFCEGGCPPGRIRFTIDIIDVTQDVLDVGLVEGELGEVVLIFNPYVDGDCGGCRPATADDVEAFYAAAAR